MKTRITIMVTVAALGFASPLYAAPMDFQTLANNFWALEYTDVTWTTSNTGTAAFGNTQGSAAQSILGQWLDSQGLYQSSYTPWDSQTALVLKNTFTVADPSLLSGIKLSVASAKGFIVWINGGNVFYRGHATGFTSYWEYNNLIVPSSLLVPGTNTMSVLAIDDVAVNTYDATFFDMQLTADPGVDLIGQGSSGWDFRIIGTIPEPASAVIFLAGLVPAMRRRRRK